MESVEVLILTLGRGHMDYKHRLSENDDDWLSSDDGPYPPIFWFVTGFCSGVAMWELIHRFM